MMKKYRFRSRTIDIILATLNYFCYEINVFFFLIIFSCILLFVNLMKTRLDHAKYKAIKEDAREKKCVDTREKTK